MEAKVIPLWEEPEWNYEVDMVEQSYINLSFDFDESTPEDWARKKIEEQTQGLKEAGYRVTYEDLVYTLEEDPEYWSGYTIEVDMVKDIPTNG